MTTITRERVAEIIHAAGLEPCDYEEVFGSIKTGEIDAMARIALASLTAEPVAWTDEQELRDVENIGIGYLFAIGGDANKFADPRRQLVLYTAPPAPVVPTFDEWLEVRGNKPLGWVKDAMRESYDACRAAMLQGAEPVSQPYTLRDGYCIMPMKLTAENGAKGALSGEFSETKFINCPECFGDDECETCDGSGRIEISVPVSWTTIKEIWAKGVEHFAAAPQQEVNNG